MRPRPETVDSITIKQEWINNNIYVTFGLSEDKELLEVFITIGKAGSEESAYAEWIAKTISMILQAITPEQVQKFLQAFIMISTGIQGGPIKFTGSGEKLLSVPDAVAKTFAKYYERTYNKSYLDSP